MSDALTDMNIPDLCVLKERVKQHLEAIDVLIKPQAPIFRRDYWNKILQDVNGELRRRDEKITRRA
jgi:hypothetical protein